MGDMCATVEKKVLDHVLGKTSYTMPTGCWASICTNATPGDPTMATPGTYTEVGSGVGYARQQITGANWVAAAQSGTSPSSSATGVTLTFGPCSTTNWGTCYGWGLHADSTIGSNTSMEFWGTLSSSVTINVGDQLQITSGNLTITLN